MLKEIKTWIEEANTIIIFRHVEPDYDALGSQFGLAYLIEDNYPDKKVYVVGSNATLKGFPAMQTIEDDIFLDALGIVVDVSQTHRVDDPRFRLTKKKIVIDHHQNGTDFADLFLHQTAAIAAAEVIGLMAIDFNWHITERSARALMFGVVADSGRFLYKGVSAKTFQVAQALLKTGIALNEIYETMYTDELAYKRLRGYALKHFNVRPSGLALLRNGPEIKDRFHVSEFTVSRGLVNVMGQLEGVEIWLNMTQTNMGTVLVELRSRQISVFEMAQKYGGGGHRLASGCTLDNWDKAEQLIADIERNLL